MDNGQMTPGGYPNLNSDLKNVHFLVFQTDGQTDGEINPFGGKPPKAW